MFLGTYQHNLMDKARLALPKKLRNELSGGKMILTIGFEQCILGFDEVKWEETTKVELEKPLFTDKVTLLCLPRNDDGDAFMAWITDLTQGQALVTEGRRLYYSEGE